MPKHLRTLLWLSLFYFPSILHGQNAIAVDLDDVNDFVYDSTRGLLFASVPARAKQLANTVVVIDPNQGAIKSSLPIGNDPSRLALSSDGKYLYVALDGESKIKRVSVEHLSVDLEFFLFGIAEAGYYKPPIVVDMKVKPGNSDVLVVVQSGVGGSGLNIVVVYQNGNMLGNKTDSRYDISRITFGEKDDILYGYNGKSTNFSVAELALSETGVRVLRSTANLGFGFFCSIKYDNGLLYTTKGRVIDPLRMTVLGGFVNDHVTWAEGEAFQPDSSTGRMYFFNHVSGYDHSLYLLAFDIHTFNYLGSIKLPDRLAPPRQMVLCGSSGLAYSAETTFGRGFQLFLIPSAVLPQSVITPLPQPEYLSGDIIKLDAPANDLAYNAANGKIYASISSTAGSWGNSIVSIEPTTGHLDAPVWMGAEPTAMAVSARGRYVYVTLRGAAAVRRLDTMNNTADRQFYMFGEFGNPLFGTCVATFSEDEDSIAVCRNDYYSTATSVAIYDSGIPRPYWIRQMNFLSSSTDGTHFLYGMDTDAYKRSIGRLRVSSEGIFASSNPIPFWEGESFPFYSVASENGILAFSTGAIFSNQSATTLREFGFCAIDSVRRRIYYLVYDPSAGFKIRGYASDTYLLAEERTIPQAKGVPLCFIRWGNGGLAFSTSAGQVFLLPYSSPVPSQVTKNSNSIILTSEGGGLVSQLLTAGNGSKSLYEVLLYLKGEGANGTHIPDSFMAALAELPKTRPVFTTALLGVAGSVCAINDDGTFQFVNLQLAPYYVSSRAFRSSVVTSPAIGSVVYTRPDDPSADLISWVATTYGASTLTQTTYHAKTVIWLSQTASVFVPVVLSSSGLNGSQFTSELTLINRGPQNVTLSFTYTPSSGSGRGTVSDQLISGQQKIVPNAIAYLRALGLSIPLQGDQIGTLSVSFSGLISRSDAAVTVRTTTAVPGGQAGLAYAGVPAELALRTPSYIWGLRQNEFDRSNVAVQNAGSTSAGDITLRLTVFSGDAPFSKALPDIRLAPGQFEQVSGILSSNGLALSNGYVRIERTSGTAPYFAYGVINDHVSSDGSFIPPLPERNTQTSGWIGPALPAVVENGDFTTEVIFTSWSATSQTLKCRCVADAIQTPDKAATFEIRIEASEQRIIPNFVQWLRDSQIPGLRPPGENFAGALFCNSADKLEGVRVTLAARTATRRQNGTYGVFYPAVDPATASTREVWIYGLQQNDFNRSNLGLVTIGSDGVAPTAANTFSIELFDGTTGKKVSVIEDIILSDDHWTQINMILKKYAPGTAQGYAHVFRTSGPNPFIVYGVINDGGEPGQRSGDGAFIASAP